MVQWINVLWNNSIVNPMQLPLLCEKTGVVTLAQPGLTAGWQADEMLQTKDWKFSSIQKGTVLL